MGKRKQAHTNIVEDYGKEINPLECVLFLISLYLFEFSISSPTVCTFTFRSILKINPDFLY